jgi:hypothetical protein
MKRSATAGLFLALLAGMSTLRAQEPPKFPAAEKEHEWLKQLAGEWESEAECAIEPGKPPVKVKGTESAHMLGGFWVIGHSKSEIMGMPYTSMMTIGYDPEKKKYVGTWVDSMTSFAWKYEGTLDASGKVLTLNTEGPCPMKPGQLSKFKEVIEIKDKDHKTFSSSMQTEDGKWVTFMTLNSRRKK